MKKIGFLSFGHWTPSPQSQTRSAADVLLAVHRPGHRGRAPRDGRRLTSESTTYARQLASPFPLLAAVGARTAHDRDRNRQSSTCGMRIRTTWPRMPAPPTSSPGRDFSSALSRGSPEQAIEGWRHFRLSALQRARMTPAWAGATPSGSSSCSKRHGLR